MVVIALVTSSGLLSRLRQSLWHLAFVLTASLSLVLGVGFMTLRGSAFLGWLYEP